MEYTLFFSYQSDTKHEFTFIKNVLEKEVHNNLLSTKGVDLRMDFGMRDVSGNPDLLKTMLEKGENCDIFLADLTYVTKFINTKGNEKYIPNPNVMLELGHAWNFHGNNHTIFIQNTSTGKSSDLPVDLKGFRFPISYELNDDISKEDMIKIRKDLSKDLTCAIEGAIDSIEEGNKVKYLPFEKFTLCQLHNNSEVFVKTKYFEQFSKTITERLASHGYVIIAGKSGCGKSRMIKEFISHGFLEQKLNDTLYCKYTQTDISNLCNKLKELIKKEFRRDTVLILDNCDDSIVDEVQSILSGFPHKCIFIMESTHSVDCAPIRINAKEYVFDIIANIAPGQETELANKCGYNPEYIIRTINNIPYTPNTYNVDRKSSTLLNYISLFSKVGFNQHREAEFNYICQLSRFSSDDGHLIIKQLINQGYIVSQGGFIFIDSDSVANEYAKQMWQQNLVEEFSFEELIDKGNLVQWFINRQIQIASQSRKCDSFLKSIINKNLRDISFVDSLLGKHITPELAELYPKQVLTSLEILCENNKEHDFQEIYGPLWAIDVIVKKREFFNRAIMLLLSLRDGSSYDKTNIKNKISGYFKYVDYDFNPNANIELFKNLYAIGQIDIIKDVYTTIFNLGYKDLSDKQIQYLKDIFLFLIHIRVENKDWANDIIVENILAARHLNISRQVFAKIRAITDENEADINVAEVLSNKIRWASSEDKRSIKSLLQSISERNSRTMLYNKVVLFKRDGIPDREMLKSSMSEIASEILKSKGWVNDVDILLGGGRRYDVNCLWFGDAVGQQYENFDELITKCLDLYREIPIEEQSYGFIIGLFYKYALEDNMLIYKEKRDELLEYPEFINIAIALSNSCENTFEDVMRIKDVLTTYSFPLAKLNDLYNMLLSEAEYCSLATELINLNKEGADAGIVLLDRARNIYKEINISNCVEDIVIRYNYWEASDCSYDSTYSKLIELLIYSLNTHPNDSIAKSTIISIINGANSQYFNNNCSLVDLFKILIERYQCLFLEQILPVIIDDSFETYRKQRNLKDLFLFQHTADNDIYLKWCEANGPSIAEFVAGFISLLKEDDNSDLRWTDEIKILMNKYNKDSYILDIISTRLFNGEISIAKYSRLKKVYDSLNEDDNRAIRLWATEQSENMDKYIKKEKEKREVEMVWYK